MYELSRMLDVYNNVYKALPNNTSIFKTLDIISSLEYCGKLSVQANGITKMVAEFQSALPTFQTQSLPFENLSSCIQAPALDTLLFSVQNALKLTAIPLNEHVHQRFIELLDETAANVSLDKESGLKFKDLLEKAKTLTISQIFNFIIGIITILSFVQSCSPNKQLEESNDLQQQQLQELQQTNELLAEQNALISESNSLDRERVEQLNKIIELQDQYVDLLLEIKEISVQDADDIN